MKNFINRPIPRLLRYELLLKNILDETPEGHEDRDYIPQVLDVIKALGKETEPGVVSAKQKVEVWRYNSNLVFKKEEQIVSCLEHSPDRIGKTDSDAHTRTWTCWMNIVHSSTLASSCVSLILDSNGMAGLNCSYSCLTTTVSNFRIVERDQTTEVLATVVMTKPKEKDGITKYHVYRRVGYI